MGAWKENPKPVNAEIVALRRDGFVIGDHLCAAPNADAQMLCFAVKGHEGDHMFRPWQGCRVRVPFGDGTVLFGGFAW